MPKGIRNLHISVDAMNLTHYGGIFLIHWFCKKLRLKWLLQKKVPFSQKINSYHPAEMVLAIIYALIAGIYRLNKTKILQGNGAFQQIVGLAQYPYASSLRRFLKRTDARCIQAINRVHDSLRLKMFYLPRPHTSLLFDIDSSALTIYGKNIEGAKVGYNPHKRGARSYHPLFCFEAHTKDYWHGVLRPGDAYTAAGCLEFFKECLGKIPPYIYRLRVRADSGFFDHEFIEFLDEKNIGYVVVAKMTPVIQRKVVALRYLSFRKDWAAAEFEYMPMNWKKPHRFIAIRRLLPEKDSSQLQLFTQQRYAYQVFVTNLPLDPANIWYFYRGRAAIEVLIKELKENYALAKIPTNSFLANQTYFYLLLFAYNLVNWFKRTCLPKEFQNSTLQTIHTELLVLPGRLVKRDNRHVLNLPSSYISKRSLEDIIRKIEKLKLS